MNTTYHLAPRLKLSKFNERKGYPIYLRFSYRGDEAWLPTGVYIKEKSHWQDSIKMIVGGPFVRQRNDIISLKQSEAEERLNLAILDGEGPNVSAFKGRSVESFEKYILQLMKNDGLNLAQGCIKAMKGFYNDKVPRIEQITVKWLRQFEDYIEGKAGLAYNTMVGYIACLRKVCNQAQREGLLKKSPFGLGLYEAPSPGKTIPRYLGDEDRIKLENALFKKKVTGDTYRVLAYFLLGTRTGLRFSDWELFDYGFQVKDGKINVQAKKNKNLINLPINNPTLEKILEIVKELGPLNIKYAQVLNILDDIQKEFKIKLQLTTHVARHTFGYLCACAGMTRTATAYFMGITEKTVEIYFHVSGKLMEEQSKQLSTI